PQRQARAERGARPLARREGGGQPRGEGEHLRPGAEAEAEAGDDRRGLQPAAARRGGHHVAEPVGHVEVAGVAGPVAGGVRPSGAPGRSSADASGPTRRRRPSAYPADSSALTGTSVKSGSPYQASRSANASLPHSVTVCTKSAVPGPMAARSKPSSSASCCKNTGPWPQGLVLHTVRPPTS